MLKEAKDIKGDIQETADVCIVGSGAGGGVMARELSIRGHNVVLLEMGRYLTASDFTQREEQMIPLLYQDQGLRATSDFSITILQGKGVGGSTNHNICLCRRAPDWVLDEWREEYGVRWISGKAMDPYYRGVEGLISVSPLGEGDVNENNNKTLVGARALGYRVSLAHHNRVDCLKCGYCEIGCAFDRKRNIACVYIPRAHRSGARIYSECSVERITFKGNEAVGVEGRFSQGQRINVKAKVTVVSAGAVDTPRLLLRSGAGAFNLRIGTNLHLHPFIAVGGVYRDRIEGWRGIPQSVIVDEFFRPANELNPRMAGRPGEGGFILIPGFAHPMAFSIQAPSLGKEYREIMRLYPFTAALGAMVHDSTEGRVTGERQGMPRIEYRLNAGDRKMLLQGMKTAGEILLASGAKRVFFPYLERVEARNASELKRVDERGIVEGKTILTSVHPQGTCAMGGSPETGAVSPQGEVYGAKNLFVADASLFPTSVGMPPQLTIMALATKVSEFIASSLRGF